MSTGDRICPDCHHYFVGSEVHICSAKRPARQYLGENGIGKNQGEINLGTLTEEEAKQIFSNISLRIEAMRQSLREAEVIVTKLEQEDKKKDTRKKRLGDVFAKIVLGVAAVFIIAGMLYSREIRILTLSLFGSGLAVWALTRTMFNSRK